ncbi:MAG: hypothetical protein OCD02_21680 [Spirochaetaceae bacterium]
MVKTLRDDHVLILNAGKKLGYAEYSRHDVQQLLIVDFLEAYRNGKSGSVYDCFIPAEWPIKLEKINGCIEVWYGVEDRSIGDMAKYIGSKIPLAKTFPISGVGHLLAFSKMNVILTSLVKEI